MKKSSATVCLYGSHHNKRDTQQIQSKIEKIEPDIVCVEAILTVDLEEHTPDVVASKKAADNISSEFWHIDVNREMNKEEIFEEIPNSKLHSVRGKVGSIRDSVRFRRNMRDASDKVFEEQIQRESSMLGAVFEAIEQYNSVFIVIGAAHIEPLYRSIVAI